MTTNPYNTPVDKVWLDPTKYSTLKDGPDFFRDRTASLKVASGILPKKAAYEAIPKLAPLASILAILRATAFLHQSHHWKTQGPTFYGDHLLFDRLYNEGLEGIDSLAEKAVGLGYGSDLDPIVQSKAVAAVIAIFASEDFIESSLKIESFALQAIDAAILKMKATGTLTSGVDNLLQGLADVHEGFLYLLKQRQQG